MVAQYGHTDHRERGRGLALRIEVHDRGVVHAALHLIRHHSQDHQRTRGLPDHLVDRHAIAPVPHDGPTGRTADVACTPFLMLHGIPVREPVRKRG